MDDNEIYVEIDRYVNREMADEALRAFETRMKQDALLAEQVAAYQSISRQLQAKHDRKDKETAFIEELHKIREENSEGSEGRIVPVSWYRWAAAACVAAVLGVGIYNFLQKPSYSDFARHEPLALVERGSSDNEKRLAQDAFNNQDYKAAIEHFDRLLIAEPQNYTLLYYKGISLLESGHIDQAEITFQTIQRSRSVLQHNATWMLALASLKKREYRQCKQLLNAIPAGADHYEEAQRLLDKL
jgi:Flp pilus assembly protein TadD